MTNSWLHVSSILALACVMTACSSSTSSPTGTPTGTSGGTSGAPSGGTSGMPAASGCTVTFGGDASTVKATSCSQMGPFVSDATVFTFTGDATGLDAPLFSYTIKFKNPLEVKTYQTADLYYISANMSVTSTDKIYDVDFDSRDATKARHGAVTATFTSADHGTIDLTFDTDDMPAQHATVHITF